MRDVDIWTLHDRIAAADKRLRDFIARMDEAQRIAAEVERRRIMEWIAEEGARRLAELRAEAGE